MLETAGIDFTSQNVGRFISNIERVSRVVNEMNRRLNTAANSLNRINELAASRRLSALSRRFTTITRNSEGFDASLRRIADQLDDTDSRVDSATTSFERLQRSQRETSETSERLARRLRRVDSSLRTFTQNANRTGIGGLGARFRDAGSGVNRFGLDIAGLGTTLGNAGSRVLDFGGRILTLGSRMAGVAAGGLALLTAGVIGLGVSSLNTAIEFESAFGDVSKTVDGLREFTPDGVIQLTEAGEDLTNQFRELSNEIPATANELASIAGLGGQLGIVDPDIQSAEEVNETLIAFSETIAGLAVATDLTQEQAATSLAQLSNIFGVTTEEFAENIQQQGDTIAFLGNSTATAESLIVNFSQRLAAASNQVGLSQATNFGLAASFAELGIRAESGGTAASRVLLDLQATLNGTQTGFLDNTAAIANLESELTSSIGTLRGLEAQAGLTGEELLASLEGLSPEQIGEQLGATERRRLFEAQTGVNELTASIAELRRTNGQAFTPERLEEFLRVVNQGRESIGEAVFDADQLAEAFQIDASTVFLDLLRGLDEEGDSAAQTIQELGFNSSEVRDLLLRSSGSADEFAENIFGANEAFDALNSGLEENRPLIQETNNRYAEVGQRLQILRNQFNNTRADLVDDFLPTIARLIDRVGEAVIAIGQELPDALGQLGNVAGRILTDLGFEFEFDVDELGQLDLEGTVISFFDSLESRLASIDTASISEDIQSIIDTVGNAINTVSTFVDSFSTDEEATEEGGIVAFIAGVRGAIDNEINAFNETKAVFDEFVSDLGISFDAVSSLGDADSVSEFFDTLSLALEPFDSVPQGLTDTLAAIGDSSLAPNINTNVDALTNLGGAFDLVLGELEESGQIDSNIADFLDSLFGENITELGDNLNDLSVSVGNLFESLGMLFGEDDSIDPTQTQESASGLEQLSTALAGLALINIAGFLDNANSFVEFLDTLTIALDDLANGEFDLSNVADLGGEIIESIVGDFDAEENQIAESIRGFIQSGLDSVGLGDIFGTGTETSIGMELSSNIAQSIVDAGDSDELDTAFGSLVNSISDRFGELSTSASTVQFSPIDLSGLFENIDITSSVDTLGEQIGLGITELSQATAGISFPPIDLSGLFENIDIDSSIQTLGSAIGTGITELSQAATSISFSPIDITGLFENVEIPDINELFTDLDVTIESLTGIPITFDISDVGSDFDQLVTDIQSSFTGLFTDIDFGLPELTDILPESVLELAGIEIDTEEAEAEAIESGRDVGAGLTQGLEEESEGFLGTVQNVAQDALDLFDITFLSESPSRATREDGEDLIAGLALGLRNLGPVTAALQAVSTTVLTSFQRLATLTVQQTVPALRSLDEILNTLFNESFPSTVEAIEDLLGIKFELTDLIAGELVPVVFELDETYSQFGFTVEGVVNPSLEAHLGLVVLTIPQYETLEEIVKRLTERYIALAKAIERAVSAGSGSINAPGSNTPNPVTPGQPGGGIPEFQTGTGGRFLSVDRDLSMAPIGPSGGRLIELHSGELFNVIASSDVDSLSLPESRFNQDVISPTVTMNAQPSTGAAISNAIENVIDNSSTVETDGRTFNLHITEAPTSNVRDSFSLMESLF